MSATTVAHVAADRGGVLGSLARSFRVWQRNRDAFLRVWKTEFGGVVAEPLLVLTAVGLGMGTYIGDIGGRSYTEFVAAGLLASYAMFGATFECTFGTYMRMETRRLFQGILATPVSVDELVRGELFWAATRSLMHATVLLTVSYIFGLTQSPYALLALPVSILIGLMFGSQAMLAASAAPSINSLTNFFTLYVVPMFFFSGVFYPVDGLPEAIQRVAWVLPLTSATELMRSLAYGEIGAQTFLSLAILIAFTVVFIPLSIRGMRRRLIK